VTSIFVLRGRRGTYGTGLALVARLVAGDAAALCVADVVHGANLRFTWQAWHMAPSTVVLRGRRLWHWAESGGALGAGLVAGDAVALCV